MELDETIVAVASSHDRGGLRGIVRLSGPDTVNVISKVFVGLDLAMELSKVQNAVRIPGELQVKPPFGPVGADVYLWPTQRSYTRQPTAEIHTHGSLPLLDAVVETVCDSGARLARPGEFTLRAFLAGRIDLAQAEAVLGVIDAVDQRELSTALEQLAGGLSEPLDKLRNTLLNLCADIEAGLDFVEDDIAFVEKETVERELVSALDVIETAKRQMESREQSNQLPRVVLRGEPNVGKSSLWNALCDEPNAIVTDRAGTTRDYLCGVVTAYGSPFELIDTAGVEPGADALDRKMLQSSEQQSERAELVLLCIDGSRELTEWEKAEIAKATSDESQIVLTKADLSSSPPLQQLPTSLRVSCHDETSVGELGERCVDLLQSLSSESSAVKSTVLRCRESLSQAQAAIKRALSLVETGAEEMVAEELREALDKLGLIVGTIYTDDILDRVFSRFCIGK